MKVTEGVLLLSATLVLVSGRPQDSLFFPEDPESPTSSPSTRIIPTTPPVTPTTLSVTQPTSTVSDGTTTTIQTTRIPPRDPGNRIVYVVSCPCLFTYQYSPVCGTDGQTYGNMGVLQCARQCGKVVDVYLSGACGSNNG